MAIFIIIIVSLIIFFTTSCGFFASLFFAILTVLGTIFVFSLIAIFTAMMSGGRTYQY